MAAIGNFVHRTLTFASNFLDGVVEKKELGDDERQRRGGKSSSRSRRRTKPSRT